MNEIAFHGAQRRIEFYGRWGLTFFAVFVVLIGWLGARYEAKALGILFELGVACTAVVVIIGAGFTWAAHQRIKRLEEHQDD